MPSKQPVAANQFAPKVDIMVAYADDENRHFDIKHVVTKLGITVPVSGGKSIRISCSQDIAGNLKIYHLSAAASDPSASITTSRSKTTTLTCAYDGGFQVGVTYCACLAPLPEGTKIRADFCTDGSGKKEVCR